MLSGRWRRWLAWLLLAAMIAGMAPTQGIASRSDGAKEEIGQRIAFSEEGTDSILPLAEGSSVTKAVYEAEALQAPVLDALPAATREDVITVSGQAAANATVTIVLQNEQTGWESSVEASTGAGEDGIAPFEGQLTFPEDGSYVVYAYTTKGEERSPDTGTIPIWYDTTPPEPIRNEGFGLLTNITLHLYWDPAEDEGSGVVGYRIYEENGSLLAETGEPGYTVDRGLEYASVYTYRITAVDGAGNESEEKTIRAGTSPENEVQLLDVTGLTVNGVALSGDGSALLYSVASGGGDHELYTLGTTSGARLKIEVTADGGAADGALYAFQTDRDGSTLAFVSDATNLKATPAEDGGREMYALDIESGEMLLLSTPGAYAQSPSIDRSGRYVAFEESGRIYRYDLIAKERTLISAAVDGAAEDGRSTIPSLSADGKRIAYRTTSTNLLGGYPLEPGMAAIVVYDVDDGGIVQFHPLVSSAIHPLSLTEDGSTLYFIKSVGNRSKIFELEVDAGVEEPIADWRPQEETRDLDYLGLRLTADGSYVFANVRNHSPSSPDMTFYAERFDTESGDVTFVGNPARPSNQVTIDEAGNRVVYRYDDVFYTYCNWECDLPAGNPIESFVWSNDSQTNGQLHPGSAMQLEAIAESGLALQATVRYKQRSAADPELVEEQQAVIALTENASTGVYHGSFALPERTTEVAAIEASLEDGSYPISARNLPIYVGGRVNVEIETDRAELLGGANLVATSAAGASTEIELLPNVKQYEIFGNAGTYTLKIVSRAERLAMAETGETVIRHGDVKSLTLTPEFPGIVKVIVEDEANRSPLPNVTVAFRSADGALLHEGKTNANGEAALPGKHYAGERIRVAVTAPEGYFPTEETTVTLGLGTTSHRVGLSSFEGIVTTALVEFPSTAGRWMRLATLDSNATVRVQGKSGLAMKAKVSYTRWKSETETETAERIVDLAEGTGGIYEGTFRIEEGMMRIDSMQVSVNGVTLNRTFPIAKQVAGRFSVRLDVPEQSVWHQALVGARLSGNSAIGVDSHYQATNVSADSLLYTLDAPFLDDNYLLSLDPSAASSAVRQTIRPETPPLGRTKEITIRPEFQIAASGLVTGTDQAQVSYRYEIWNADTLTTSGWGNRGAMEARFKARPGDRVQVKLIPQDIGYASRTFDFVVEGPRIDATTELEKKPEGRISGRVSAKDGRPAPRVSVSATVSQDGVIKTYWTSTDANGVYELAVPQGEAEVRASGHSAYGYASPRVTVEATPSGANADLQLKDQGKLNLSLFTKYGDGPWQGPIDLDWRSIVHYYVTSSPQITQIGASGKPSLVAGVEGDTIRVCADGRDGGLPSACKEAVIGSNGEANIELRLENGGGEAQFKLVDKNGSPLQSAYVTLFRKQDNSFTEHSLRMNEAKDRFIVPVAGTGEQRMMIRSGYSPSMIVEFTATVGGVVDLGTVALRDFGVFETVNGNGVTASSDWTASGGRFSVRASYAHSRPGAMPVSNAKLTLTLPEGASVVEGSAILNGAAVTPEVNGTTLSVPIGDVSYQDRGSFQVQLQSDAQTLQPLFSLQGSMKYTQNGEAWEDMLGIAVLQVVPATIRVPAIAVKRDITVSGTAPAGAEIAVFDDNVELGRATATETGTWKLPITLLDNGKRKHRVSVGLLQGGSVKMGQRAAVLYDPTDPGLETVSMQQSDGRLITFRTEDGVAVFPYVVVPGYPFHYTMTFRNPDRVSNVKVHIGEMRAEAVRDGDVFRAVVPYKGDPGPVKVTYDKVPDAIPPYGGEPTEEQIRDEVAEPFRDFKNEFMVEGPASAPDGKTVPAGTYYSRTQLNDELTATVTASGIVLDDYAPSAAEEAKVRQTGIPVYDVKVDRKIGERTAKLSVTATLLTDGAGASGRFAASSAAALVNPKAVTVSMDVALDVGNYGLGMRDVIVGTVGLSDHNSLVNRAVRAHRMAKALCDPKAREYYTDWADGVKTMVALHETFKGGAGAAGTAKAKGWAGIAIWAATYHVGNELDRIAGEELDELEKYIQQNQCKLQPFPEPDAEPKYIWDPSGYVYEGIPTNVLEGVTATALEWDPAAGRWNVWDAEWYEQTNPHPTNGLGRYGWDVPPGRWKVQWEKEGYETAYSAELEVPPPHFDVNVGLVSYDPPEVAYAEAPAGGTTIEVGFTKPMDAASLREDSIVVTSSEGAAQAGTVRAKDPVVVDGKTLAMAVEFVANAPFVDGARYDVTVSGGIASYAGVLLGDDAVRQVTVYVEDTIPPSPVTGVTGNLAGGEAALTWSNPAERDVTGVLVRWKKAADAVYGEPLAVEGGAEWTVVPDIEEGAAYDFSVTAVDAAGNESAPATWRLAGASPEALDLTPPGPVSGFAVTSRGSDALTFGWEDPVDRDLAKVRLTWSTGDGAEASTTDVNAGVRTATIRGLAANTVYAIAVTTVDAAGNESGAAYFKAKTDPSVGGGRGRGGGGGAPPPAQDAANEAEWTIDAAGGWFEAFDGKLKLFVEKAAFGTSDAARKLRVFAKEAAGAAERYVPLSASYEIRGEAGEETPTKPLRLSLVYDEEALGGRDPRRLGLYRKEASAPDGWAYVGGVVSPENGTVTAEIEELGEYAAMLYDRSFADLSGHWSREEVEVLISRHLVDGTGADRFEPDRSITRAEATKLLVASLREPPADAAGERFADVAGDAWYAPYVAAAAKLGLVEGAEGKFRPNDPVTREELAVLLARWHRLAGGADETGDAGALNRFADGDATSVWAREAVALSVTRGWLQGVGETELQPLGQATRAQAAALLLRALASLGNVTE